MGLESIADGLALVWYWSNFIANVNLAGVGIYYSVIGTMVVKNVKE